MSEREITEQSKELRLDILSKVLAKILRSQGFNIVDINIEIVCNPIDKRYKILNHFNPNPPKIRILGEGLTSQLKDNVRELSLIFLRFTLGGNPKPDLLKDSCLLIHINQ